MLHCKQLQCRSYKLYWDPFDTQAESLDTPPGTPASARSLPISLITTNLSKLVKPETTRRRPYKLVENLGMTDISVKPKTKERKGEH
jgi:hypothetical protein